jgi:hypothetical protein
MISNSRVCEINGLVTSSVISGSSDSKIDNFAGSNQMIGDTIESCSLCEIKNTALVSVLNTRNVIMGSESSNIESSGTQTKDNTIFAARNGLIQNSSYCFAAGDGGSLIGCSNSASLCGAVLASANNTLGIEGDVVIQGTNNDLTVENGYVLSNKGFVGPYSTHSSALNPLSTTNSFVNTTNGSNIFLSPAATTASNYPLNTSRLFHITSDPNLAGTAQTNIIINGGGTFNGKPGFTRHTLPQAGGSALIAINGGVTPSWSIFGNSLYSARSVMTSANNFGLTPPQSDANQLPTSTSRINHRSLTTTSYVTFDTFNATINGNPSVFSSASPGITINAVGTYKFEYDIYIVGGGAGTNNYTIRADLYDSTSSQNMDESFSSCSGINSSAGENSLFKATNFFAIKTVPTTIQLRISQSNTDPISSSASISRCCLVAIAQL